MKKLDKNIDKLQTEKEKIFERNAKRKIKRYKYRKLNITEKVGDGSDK